MNSSDSIPSGTIPQYIAQGHVERVTITIDTQDQVERSGPRTMMPPRPVFEGVTPETPKLWGTRGDLEPMMTNEEKVVRFFLQPVKIIPEGDIPKENLAKHFGWELENVQQRVSSAFEICDDRLMLSDLFVQS